MCKTITWFNTLHHCYLSTLFFLLRTNVAFFYSIRVLVFLIQTLIHSRYTTCVQRLLAVGSPFHRGSSSDSLKASVSFSSKVHSSGVCGGRGSFLRLVYCLSRGSAIHHCTGRAPLQMLRRKTTSFRTCLDSTRALLCLKVWSCCISCTNARLPVLFLSVSISLSLSLFFFFC